MKVLLACFEPTLGVFNRRVSHRPWRKQRFDRCFADQGWWPGASFVVSLAEAHALTGRPLLELETFVGTQVWTRWDGRYGDVPLRPRTAAGPDRLRMIETPTKGWACIKPQDALKHVLVVGPTGVGKSTFLYWWARSVIEQGHGLLVLDPKGDLVDGAVGGRAVRTAPTTRSCSTSPTPSGRWRSTRWTCGMRPRVTGWLLPSTR